jgi:hypothetical protein
MFYARLLKTYPITTKSITSGILFSIGDIVTQVGKRIIKCRDLIKKII